jgi:hypothetical protein
MMVKRLFHRIYLSRTQINHQYRKNQVMIHQVLHRQNNILINNLNLL